MFPPAFEHRAVATLPDLIPGRYKFLENIQKLKVKNFYLSSQLLVASASSARSTIGTDPDMKLELAVLIPPNVAFVMSDIPTWIPDCKT